MIAKNYLNPAINDQITLGSRGGGFLNQGTVCTLVHKRLVIEFDQISTINTFVMTAGFRQFFSAITISPVTGIRIVYRYLSCTVIRPGKDYDSKTNLLQKQ